ncbi:MAG: hypothetical protein K2P63_02930 [Lachnospiraceae bacterium]|nr:hypothetical protein [Lachnospiraceae bacterium]
MDHHDLMQAEQKSAFLIQETYIYCAEGNPGGMVYEKNEKGIKSASGKLADNGGI